MNPTAFHDLDWELCAIFKIGVFTYLDVGSVSNADSCDAESHKSGGDLERNHLE